MAVHPEEARGREHSLVIACKAGDPAAFTSLYRQENARVFRVCASLLDNPAQTEDAVQLVFTEAFRRLHTFDHTSKMSTWLHAIALRVVANMRRTNRRRARRITAFVHDQKAEQKGVPDPERETSQREAIAVLQAGLAKLSPKKRTAFLLYHGAGLTIREVGEVTGVPLKTAANRISSARRDLLRALGPREGPLE